MELFTKIVNGLKTLTTFSKVLSCMFDQALNTLVYMTNNFVLFLFCILFLVCYNQSIAAGRLPRRVKIDGCYQ